MTPSGIEPATFRFVAQHLNNCATEVLRGGIRTEFWRRDLVKVMYWEDQKRDGAHNLT